MGGTSIVAGDDNETLRDNFRYRNISKIRSGGNNSRINFLDGKSLGGGA